MKWCATNNCAKNVPTHVQNEIHAGLISEITRPEMTARPLKKAKYACQAQERSENGLHVSPYPICENVDEKSNCDSSQDATTSREGTCTDHASTSSCNGLPTMSLNASSGEDLTQMASTSSMAHGFPEGLVENPNSGQQNEASNCDCNANKNNAPKQINFALCRWQSKQLAQGIIDNAINKVLGDLGIPSNHGETMNSAFGEPISWGSYLNAHNIENEGVAEAIRQQGLQHKRLVQQPSGSRQEDCATNNIPRESPEETFRSGLNGPSGSTMSENAFAMDANLLDDIPAASFATSLSKKSDLTSLLRVQNTMLQNPDLFDEALMKPEDLLNTAVSYAISEKGLGVLNVNE